MDTKTGLTYLKEKNINEHPIWTRNEVDDLIYPVYGPDDFPDDSTNLFIRSAFTAANGATFKGYIIGVKHIYCIVIFWKEKIYYLNKNLFDDCIKVINEIDADLKLNATPNDYFPMQYKTTIDLENFKNIEGEFDIFKKRTDAERLDFDWQF